MLRKQKVNELTNRIKKICDIEEDQSTLTKMLTKHYPVFFYLNKNALQ